MELRSKSYYSSDILPYDPMAFRRGDGLSDEDAKVSCYYDPYPPDIRITSHRKQQDRPAYRPCDASDCDQSYRLKELAVQRYLPMPQSDKPEPKKQKAAIGETAFRIPGIRWLLVFKKRMTGLLQTITKFFRKA